MDNRKEIINNYYNNYDEDNRLIKDKAHRLEFVISTEYLKKYIKPADKILEVGAGTGRYSIYYAKQGYDVSAIEYVEHNLNILKGKITPDMKMKARQGDAVDLSGFEDNTFDVTLVLGPLYHLYNDDDIHQAIEEAVRVTKQNGIIAIAYITSDGVACLIPDKINRLSEEEFNIWIKYQLSVCEREDLQGYSCHMLYICRKIN